MATRSADAAVVDGELIVSNPKWWSNELAIAFKNGDKVTITVQTREKKRTLRQNSTLHWYVQEIADETGMDRDEVKEILRLKFLSVPVLNRDGEEMCDESTGEVLMRLKSTTELSTIEFCEFTEKIRVWAMEFLRINLPLPSESTELKF